MDARFSISSDGAIPTSEYLKSLAQWPDFCKQEITTALISHVYSRDINIDRENDFAEKASKLIDKPHLKSIINEFVQ